MPNVIDRQFDSTTVSLRFVKTEYDFGRCVKLAEPTKPRRKSGMRATRYLRAGKGGHSARKAATGSRFEASTAGNRLARTLMAANSAIAKTRVARS